MDRTRKTSSTGQRGTKKELAVLAYGNHGAHRLRRHTYRHHLSFEAVMISHPVPTSVTTTARQSGPLSAAARDLTRGTKTVKKGGTKRGTLLLHLFETCHFV